MDTIPSYKESEYYKQLDGSLNQNIIRNLVVENMVINADNFIYDSIGRRWTFENWLRRSFRTAIANDLLNNSMNLMNMYNVELCFSSYLGDSSKLCVNYQNRVYTVKEEISSRYSTIESALWRHGGGLIHPNCRHTIEPYFKGITELDESNPLSKGEINKNYKDRQNYLAYDRNYRKYKKNSDLEKFSGINNKKNNMKAKEWRRRRNNIKPPSDSAFDVNID